MALKTGGVWSITPVNFGRMLWMDSSVMWSFEFSSELVMFPAMSSVVVSNPSLTPAR